MLEYDEERNILFAFKNKLAIPKPPERGNNINYESLKQYLDRQMKDDVTNIFFPKLQECLKADDYDLVIDDIDYRQEDAGYFNNQSYSIRVKFNSPHTISDDKDSCQYITIMKIPYITRDGILLSESKKYSFIKIMEQQDTISYDSAKSTLKIKFPRGFITFTVDKDKIKLSLSAIRSKSDVKNFNAMCALFAMAKYEKYDPYNVFEEFKNYQIRNMYRDEEKLEYDISYYGGNRGSINAIDYDETFIPYIKGIKLNVDDTTNKMYALGPLRNDLNELLSLDRAVGKILAEDVISNTKKGKIVCYAGTIITSATIRNCKLNGVYKLLIDNTPNIEGYYLADKVIINFIPKGTKLIPELQEILPEEKGMYVSKDYYFEAKDTIWFGSNTKLSKALIEMFQKCGYTKVLVSMKKNRTELDKKDVVTMYFMEEIVSNKHFRKADIGLADNFNNEWVYLDKDNNFVEAKDYLTTYDLVSIISLLVKLKQGEYYNTVINSDSGFRKKLVMPAHQYHKAFEYACEQGFKQMNRSIKEAWNKSRYEFFIADIMENKFFPFEKAFFKYLRDVAKCLQMLKDDVLTNPLSYISACNKINVFVKDKNSISDTQRRIPIGSYGKIDAYETPQSAKMGVVLNQAIGCEIDLDGAMRTSYYKVKHIGSRSMVTNEKVSLTVQEEEKMKIADITSLELKDNGEVIDTSKVVLCRVPSLNSIDKQAFAYVPISEVDLVNCTSDQYLSWTTSSIPAMGADDAIRVVFGVAQTKQAKGLVDSQVPRVMTYTHLYAPLLNDEFCIIAKHDGVVEGVYKDRRSLSGNNKVTYESMKRESNVWHLNVVYDNDSEGTRYEFTEYTNTKYSVTVRDILVKEGERFKKGDVLVSSNFIKDGILAMGRNALVAYVPDGFNYEDGVHASDKFCNDLTSYRINTEEFENTYKGSRLRISYQRKGRWITPNSDTAFSLHIMNKKFPKGKERNYTTTKGKGFLEKARLVVNKGKYGTESYDEVCVDLVSVDTFGSGDKASNSHGNKGVLPKKESNSNMLRLKNGIPIDIVYNPLGLSSRMNTGQTLECNKGLVMEVLDSHICADSFNGMSKREIKMMLKYTYELCNSTGDPMIICNKYPEIPATFHKHVCRNIDKIRLWAGCFDENGEGYLINPKNGNRLTETKVLIGYVNVMKMIQESEVKLHVRGGAMAGEPYSLISNAPTKSASERGGQRYGTMEMDALCGYGVSSLIQNFVNEQGDNPIARNNINVETFLPDSVKSNYLIESKGQRRAVTRFLYSMLALGIYVECDDDEFIPLSKDNGDLGYWTVKSLMKASSTESASSIQTPQEELDEKISDYTSRIDEVLGQIKKGS